MAQVYNFTDRNGEVRLQAEIDPAPVSAPPDLATVLVQGGDPDGNPITAPLTIDVGALATAGGLTLTGTGGANVNRLVVDFLHTLFELTGDGSLTFSSDDSAGISVQGTGDTGANLQVTNGPTSTSARLIANTNGGEAIVSNASNSFAAAISYLYGLAVAVNAAPDDATLLNGMASIWFDQTNGAGATKLMVKGKSADGTVKTAAIVLT